MFTFGTEGRSAVYSKHSFATRVSRSLIGIAFENSLSSQFETLAALQVIPSF
jgi:hypothetical protein